MTAALFELENSRVMTPMSSAKKVVVISARGGDGDKKSAFGVLSSLGDTLNNKILDRTMSPPNIPN